MTLLPGYLINADVGDATQVPAGKVEGNHIGDGGSNGTPGAVEQSCDLKPRQQLCPRSDGNRKRLGQSLLASSPRYALHMHGLATGTSNTAG